MHDRASYQEVMDEMTDAGTVVPNRKEMNLDHGRSGVGQD